MKSDALVLIFSRNAFYKHLLYLALAALSLGIIIILVLLFMIGYLLRTPTRPLYFATDEVGRLIDVIPVNRPNLSPSEITAWTVEAVVAAKSFDFINYRAQLQSAQRYFTSYGWTNYMNGLRASNALISLQNYKEIVLSRVVGEPKLIAQGLLGGAYAWKYQMQLLTTHYRPPFDRAEYSNAFLETVVVQRQPILQGYRGLGVAQLIEEFATSTAPEQQISGSEAQ